MYGEYTTICHYAKHSFLCFVLYTARSWKIKFNCQLIAWFLAFGQIKSTDIWKPKGQKPKFDKLNVPATHHSKCVKALIQGNNTH